MDEPRSRPLTRLDFSLLLLAMAVAFGMRLWQLTHTEVLARDSIGYIRMAWEIEQLGWKPAVTTAEQHPGYPLTILAVRHLCGSWLGEDLPFAWQLAAQIASSLASILLVIPVYLLARRLFDPPIALTAALLLQCFPAVGRLLGDGLAEAVFLLFAAFAFWATLVAFETGRPRWFVLAGVCSGAAYVVRPEGLLIAFCAGLVLLGRQCFRTTRQPWRPCLAQGVGLSVASLLFVALFILATGKLTLKPTAGRLIGGETVRAPRSAGPLLAAWWEEGGELQRNQRIGWAARQLVFMLVRATFYVGVLFGLLGLWWFRDRLVRPGVLVSGLVSGMIGILLFRVAWYLGYLSDRHLALIVLAFVPFIAAGLVETGRRLPRAPVWLPAVLVLALLLPAAYRTLLPLHDEREGFREAGEWLARHTNPGDPVRDPFCWTHYYAGRVFVEKTGPVATSEPPIEYIVHEQGTSRHFRLRDHIQKLDARRVHGHLVRSWPLRRGALEVWAVPRDRTTESP